MYNINNNQQRRNFAFVGNNGFGVTTSEATLIDAFRQLHCTTITEMPTLEDARKFAYCAYSGRFVSRNYQNGVQLLIPANLPLDYIFEDEYYEQREGKRPLQWFFPGLPM